MFFLPSLGEGKKMFFLPSLGEGNKIFCPGLRNPFMPQNPSVF